MFASQYEFSISKVYLQVKILMCLDLIFFQDPTSLILIVFVCNLV